MCPSGGCLRPAPVVVVVVVAVAVQLAAVPTGSAPAAALTTMKAVHVLDLDRPDHRQLKETIESQVLGRRLTGYLPKNQWIVCLSADQIDRIGEMQVGVSPLPVERRLAPGLPTAESGAGADLIIELCENGDRDLDADLRAVKPAVDALGVVLERVSDRRLKAHLTGSTPAAQIGRALIDVMPEIVWIERKATIVLL